MKKSENYGLNETNGWTYSLIVCLFTSTYFWNAIYRNTQTVH